MTAVSALYSPVDWDDPEDPDWAKAFVLAELVRLVEVGGASMRRLESGVIELCFPTGETFHLGEEAITRVV